MEFGRRLDGSRVHFNTPRVDAAVAVRLALGALCLAILTQGACSSLQVWRDSSSLARRWEGQPAPDLSFTTVDGQDVVLADLRGERVLLSLWATWCMPCRVEMPTIGKLVAEHGTAGVRVFGLSFEGESAIRAFAEEYEIQYPLASVSEDGLAAPYNGAPAFPTSFVIDADGRIEHVHVGYLTANQLEGLLWGK